MGPFCSYFFHTKYTSSARKWWLLVLLLQRTKIWTERLLSNLQNSWYFLRLWIFCGEAQIWYFSFAQILFSSWKWTYQTFLWFTSIYTSFCGGGNTTSVVETGTRANTEEFLFQKAQIFRLNFFVKKLEIKKGQKNIVLFDDLIQRGRFFLNLP